MTKPSLIERRSPPPLMAINTAWQPPWLLAAVAEHGQHHYDDGAPMQDAHRLSLVGPHVVLAVADGVGSQPLSAIGARLAVTAAEAHLAGHLGHGMPTPSVLQAAMAAAHAAIAAQAAADEQPLHAYAATLNVAVLTDDHVAAAGVGDSSVLAYTESGIGKRRRLVAFLSNPQSAGRGVYSISSPDWEARCAIRAESYPNLKGLLLTSDGANNLFTVDSSTEGYTGFDCETLDGIDGALEAFGTRCFAFYWAGYLAGTPANDLDDRTILMAYKPTVPPSFKGV